MGASDELRMHGDELTCGRLMLQGSHITRRLQLRHSW